QLGETSRGPDPPAGFRTRLLRFGVDHVDRPDVAHRLAFVALAAPCSRPGRRFRRPAARLPIRRYRKGARPAPDSLPPTDNTARGRAPSRASTGERKSV